MLKYPTYTLRFHHSRCRTIPKLVSHAVNTPWTQKRDQTRIDNATSAHLSATMVSFIPPPFPKNHGATMRIANCRKRNEGDPQRAAGDEPRQSQKLGRVVLLCNGKTRYSGSCTRRQQQNLLLFRRRLLPSRRDRATPPEISMRKQASTKSVLIQLTCVTFQLVHLPARDRTSILHFAG